MKHSYGAVVFKTSGVGIDHSIGFASDRNYLYCSSDDELSIWDKKDFTRIATLISPHSIIRIKIDDSYIYFGETVWTANDWKKIHVFEDAIGSAFAFDQDHLYFRIRNRISVAKKGSWKVVREFDTHEVARNLLASDRDYLYMNGRKDPTYGRGYIWKYSKRDWTKTLERRVHKDHIKKLDTDEKFLYFQGWKHGVGVLRKDDLEEVALLKDHQIDDFTIDDNHIFTSSGDLFSEGNWKLSIWDTGNYEMIEKKEFPSAIIGLEADSDYLYCGVKDKGIIIYDKDWNQRHIIPCADNQMVNLWRGKEYSLSGHLNGRIGVRSRTDLGLVRELKCSKQLGLIAADECFLYVLSEALPSKINILKLKDFSKFAMVYAGMGGKNWLQDILCSDYIYGLIDDNRLAFWLKENPEKRNEMTLPWEDNLKYSSLKCVHIEGDIVYLGVKGGIIIWNSASQTEVDFLSTRFTSVDQISTDADYIYAISDYRIIVWSKEHRKNVAVFRLPRGGVRMALGNDFVYQIPGRYLYRPSIIRIEVLSKPDFKRMGSIHGFERLVFGVRENDMSIITTESDGTTKEWDKESLQRVDSAIKSEPEFKWTRSTILAFPNREVNDSYRREFIEILAFNKPLVIEFLDSNAIHVIEPEYAKSHPAKYKEHLDEIARLTQ